MLLLLFLFFTVSQTRWPTFLFSSSAPCHHRKSFLRPWKGRIFFKSNIWKSENVLKIYQRGRKYVPEKNLFGRWISIVAKVYSRHNEIIKKKNLPHRLEYLLFTGCKINNQTIYNYRKLYNLISVAQKLLNVTC